MMTLLLVLPLLFSCTDDGRPITEIGNPEMTVSVRTFTSRPEWVGDRIVVEGVDASLGDVRFIDCDGGAPFVLVGPADAELVAGVQRTSVDRPAKPVCGVELDLEAGLQIAGFNEAGVPFEVTAEVGAVPSASGAAYEVPSGGHLIVGFDLAVWLDGVPLDGPPDADGVIRPSFVGDFDTVALLEDVDEDGVADDDELAEPLASSVPELPDRDGDGLTDDNEAFVHGTDPDVSDTDGDRLLDGEEVLVYDTDPLLTDTDGGGTDDGAEVVAGTDPLDPADD